MLSFRLAAPLLLTVLAAAAPLRQTAIPAAPADAAAALLVWDVDAPLRNGLPRNFRTTDDKPDETKGSLPGWAGLETLRAAGGAQYTEEGLKQVLARLPGPVTVFDLRQESHLFVNGVAVSWFATRNWANAGKDSTEVERDEGRRAQAFEPGQKLTLSDDEAVKKSGKPAAPETVEVHTVRTERQWAEANGARYVRVGVSDHTRPLDAEVDRFVKAVRELPTGAWVYFHCRAGRGRTTTFMALYDMLRNADKVSVEDIARRQELIGHDYDVLKTAESGSWKAPYVDDRIAFVRAFHAYAQANPGGRPLLWTEWLASQKN